MNVFSKWRVLAPLFALIALAAISMATQASAGSKSPKRAHRSSLGLTSGLLPRDHLTEESARTRG